jgi:AraC-like DNA-binding protein
MRGTAELLGELGVAIEPLLDRVQIPRAALNEEDMRISLPAYAHMLEVASELAHCHDLGLRIAERQDISILGPLAIAMQNAATVGEALAICSRYMHVHSPGIRISIHHDSPQPGQTSLRLALVIPGWLPKRQVMDQCVADLYHFAGWLAQGSAPLISVSLPHRALVEPERYAKLFGLEVDFDRPHAEFVVSSEFLAQSLVGASSTLLQISVDYLQLAFARDAQTVGERVDEVLRRALSGTRGRREVVARLLGMHPRTLQRRLAEEGQCFKSMVDVARREQAHHWLTRTDTPLAQVAGVLGLSDQTVLCRNCMRWFGRTPAGVRSQGIVKH